MATPELGKLEPAEIRAVWKNEASDFTPWLASPAGLEMLSEAIELELEAKEMEKAIGRFSADLICSVPETDKLVLVENQFGTTDHDHLGKMLTYAAALDEVVAVVWIAEKFHDEHRAALDWLNKITPQTVSFLGLEIEAWVIGSSPPAPKLNVVCRPNDWSRPEPSGLSELQKLRLAFWTAFKQHLEDQGGDLVAYKPSAENWCNVRSGIPGMVLLVVLRPGVLDAQLYSNGGHKELFRELESRVNGMSLPVEGALAFANDPSKKYASVGVKREGDVADRDRWPEYMAWFSARLLELKTVFTPLIAETQADMVKQGVSDS